MGTYNRPVLDRLADGSEWQCDCLIWTGYSDRQGYGKISISTGGRRKLMKVSRAAWVARHGEPPPDTPHVLHRCDNPPCWRDEHLWLGTNADNCADKMAKGRHSNTLKTHCKRGHAFTPENTIIKSSGARNCRACDNVQQRSRYARRVTASAG